MILLFSPFGIITVKSGRDINERLCPPPPHLPLVLTGPYLSFQTRGLSLLSEGSDTDIIPTTETPSLALSIPSKTAPRVYV